LRLLITFAALKSVEKNHKRIMVKIGISRKKEPNIRELSLPYILLIVLYCVQSPSVYAGNKTTSGTNRAVTAPSSDEEVVSVARPGNVILLTAEPTESPNIIIDGSTIIINRGVTKPETSKDAKIEIDNPQISVQQKDNGEDAVYTTVDNMPEFPGGDIALRKFISKAVRYPSIAAEKSIQGRVFVKYIVNKDGRVSDAKIARGVDPSIDNEAIRVVMSLPKFKPGMQNGKVVRVSLVVPISFQLM
jgi:periplasmic protein TonB